MALAVLKIRAIRPWEKAYKVADEKGLYLLVKPSGAMLWRLKYRFHGVERKLAFGSYPEVSLKEARQQLGNGVDPSASKKQAALEASLNAAATFRALADEFIEIYARAVGREQDIVDLTELDDVTRAERSASKS